MADISVKSIPTKVNKYNIYDEGIRLLGTGDELTLPDFENVSEAISGAGILGEFEDPTVGYFGNQTMEIPWRLLDRAAAKALNVLKTMHLEIRGACQYLNSVGDIEIGSIRVVVRGKGASLKSGKLKATTSMESGVTLNLTYILIEINEEEVVLLDKLNEEFRVLGEDVLAKIKEYC